MPAYVRCEGPHDVTLDHDMDHAQRYLPGIVHYLVLSDVLAVTIERELGTFRYTLVKGSGA